MSVASRARKDPSNFGFLLLERNGITCHFGGIVLYVGSFVKADFDGLGYKKSKGNCTLIKKAGLNRK